jgi:hypothetical protein
MTPIRPVIMCGGAGARLWPFSRQAFPKQLLPVVGDRSLLQETAARVASDEFSPPLIVTGKDHGQIVERQLEEIGIRPAAILLEPEARNTAAVAALAAEWALAESQDELLLLLPSDHFILDSAAFVRAVQSGASQALDGGIVMLGVEAREANSQYGYIYAKDGPAGGRPARPELRRKAGCLNGRELLRLGTPFLECGHFPGARDHPARGTERVPARHARCSRPGIATEPLGRSVRSS